MVTSAAWAKDIAINTAKIAITARVTKPRACVSASFASARASSIALSISRADAAAGSRVSGSEEVAMRGLRCTDRTKLPRPAARC